MYSCVAFASTYYQYSYEVNKLNGVTSASDRVIYSPKWTYNLSNFGSDNGTSLSYAYTMLKQFGCLKLSDLPYDDDYLWIPGNTNLNANEMIAERMEALETRVSDVGTCSIAANGTVINGPNSSALRLVKQLLNSGKVLTITTNAKYNYKNGRDRNGNIIKVNYRAYSGGGGHAMAVVGYDDNVWCDVNGNGIAEECEKGAFKLANSYGIPGGVNDTNGFRWVLYDSLNKVSANTVNSWENNLSGARVCAFNGDNQTFWYINVEKKNVNFVGEIDLDVTQLFENSFQNGRAPVSNSNVNYNGSMWINSRAAYKGKLLFDYDNYCAPISQYLSGYDWYVKFSKLNGVYNFKMVDNFENIIKEYGAKNSNLTKKVNVSLIYGDVDYSGGLTMNDAYIIQQYVLGYRQFSNLQNVIGDTNQDGEINLADSVLIQQLIIKH